MTDQIREQVSALLDGELPHDEISLLMRRLERDAELRRAFGAYALIGETLRAPGGRIASPSFASRVAASIDAAPRAADPAADPSAAAAADRYTFWKRPVLRTALAASAAAAAVLLFRPEPALRVAAVDQHGSTASGRYEMAASPTPAMSQRLASYMVAHSQYSTPMVRRNVLSSLLAADPGLTRVSYETGEAP